MPELPDITLFAQNLNKLFAGKKLQKVKVVSGKKLPDPAAHLTKTLEGKTLKKVERSGKELRFFFDKNLVMGMHLMLTGDIFLFDSTNERKTTIVELYFQGGNAIALCDRLKNAYIKLNPVDKEGIDALAITYPQLSKALQRKANIKNLLMDQDVIRGIGNSYADEILWEAKISPFSEAKAIPDDVVKKLPGVIKRVLKTAIRQITKKYPDKLNVEVKEFLKIHHKDRVTSPTGGKIKVDTKGMRKTFYTDEQILYKS